MKINWPAPGKYIVAVSGGVDSVVLLDMLENENRQYMLTVAYIDHGWRETSAERKLVQELSCKYDLAFRHIKLNLQTTSEEEAREGRYGALEALRKELKADATLTAHHADDRAETVVMNVLRGTGRRGLSSLQPTANVLRPLLQLTKSEIIAYAGKHELAWVEDPTNTDTKYHRNAVRHDLLPRLERNNPSVVTEILQISDAALVLNAHLDKELEHWMQIYAKQVRQGFEIPIEQLCQLSLAAVREVVVYAARLLENGIELDAVAVAELALHIKTGRLKSRRRLHGRLFVGRRYDTLTITVSDL